MLKHIWSERELMLKRNEALWNSLKNLADPSLEDEFRQSCFALSHNTLIKRRFIENINDHIGYELNDAVLT